MDERIRAPRQDGSAPARFRMLPGRMRYALLWTHRWLGLIGGLVVVLIGLTGSFIAFYREIDVALNPAFYAPASPEQKVTLSEVMRAAAAADPAPIATILAPDRTWPVWIVIHTHETAPGRYPNRWTTMVDPSNGKVLGRRDYVNAFALKVYRLHYTLLLYEWWGKELVGTAGFMLLGLAISGLVLWWPRPGLFWRSVSVRKNVSLLRFVLDIHSAAGFWALLVLLVISITGVGIVFPDMMRPIVGLLSQTTPDRSPRVEMPPSAETQLLPADAIARLAQAAKPGVAIAMFNPPTATRNTWRVQFRPDGADPAVRAWGAIWLDPWSGAVVHDRSPVAMSMGDRYLAEQLWLHNGAAFGLAGRLLVFAAGFAPLALFVSGLIMWLKRRPGGVRVTAARSSRRG